jgi:Zn-dependent M28 family amino/carboxypeptidase
VLEDEMRNDLYFLSSDRLEGRGVGTAGLDIAADYVAARFAALGLRPLPGLDGYFQPFDITTAEGIDDGTTLASGDKTYKLKDDYTALSFSAEKSFAAPVVFVGYGVADKERAYDDYAGVDVKGKVVIAMRFEPHDAKGKSAWTHGDWTSNSHLETKAKAAADRGAVALLLVNPPTFHDQVVPTPGDKITDLKLDDDALVPFARQGVGSAASIPVLHVKRAIADELLKRGGAGTVKELQGKIDAATKPASAALKDVTAKGKVAIKRTKKQVKNVVAMLPGSGPLADEYVIVGAHYDHLGWGGRGSLMNVPLLQRQPGITEPANGNGKPATTRATTGAATTTTTNPHATNPHAVNPHAASPDGEMLTPHVVDPHGVAAATGPTTRPATAPTTRAIHHGADDNGSGTVTMLELARICSRRAAAGQPPRRTLVFCSFTAEEMGLIGSARFANHPPIDLKKAVAMLNLDMVGRIRKNLLYVGGGGTAEPFESMLKRADLDSPLEFKNFGKGGMGPSDHMSFAVKKVPVIFLFSGTHEDYHRPTDTPDKINYAGMADVARLSMTLIDDMTNMPLSKYVDAADKGSMMNPMTSGTGGDTVGDGPRRASLGIIPEYGDEEDGKGVRIGGTTAGTAAAKAGLQGGDVILELGGMPTGTLMELTTAIGAKKPGDKVKLVYQRGGQKVTTEVTLGARGG